MPVARPRMPPTTTTAPPAQTSHHVGPTISPTPPMMKPTIMMLIDTHDTGRPWKATCWPGAPETSDGDRADPCDSSPDDSLFAPCTVPDPTWSAMRLLLSSATPPRSPLWPGPAGGVRRPPEQRACFAADSVSPPISPTMTVITVAPARHRPAPSAVTGGHGAQGGGSA